MTRPATGEEIAALVAHFGVPNIEEYVLTNWRQDVQPWYVGDTSTILQGILATIDLDHRKAWLFMTLDDMTPGYLAVMYHRDSWPWHWIQADNNHEAIKLFASYVTVMDEHDQLAEYIEQLKTEIGERR